MLTALRRKFRLGMQRTVLIAVLLAVGVFSYAFLNLKFCYKIMSHRSLTQMCQKYEQHEYSGSLCEELCGSQKSFDNFQCPLNDMKTILFTAEKNGDMYAVKLAKHNDDELSWTNSNGEAIYPKIEEFHEIVKLHIILSYNVTLDDNMIRALVNQEIANNNSQQMMSFWRLFKDNNYMMGKLFDEESTFPAVLGSCGPYYATESLQIVQSNPSIMQYLASNRQQRLKHALNIMEYIFRLDEMKPEPLKMCKMQVNRFGVTTDRRLKYQSAEHIYVESQLDKRMSSGSACQAHADCSFHACRGLCDAERQKCTHIEQNNNFQIFCEHILLGSGTFQPGLLSGIRMPRTLQLVLKQCINPSKEHQVPGRRQAPNVQLALRLYNELKQLYQAVSTGASSATAADASLRQQGRK
ncbi:divergent protein kinase domain 1C [Scaptodrosophila lebanonensis]|uniref:Divergent protein kinase domain 1C n=1 Tax=Drosophila lebanonensis TaxID=7225 RepID=A0A6J2TDE9_DROLE|nr:divergent protein kinase domain 1C [Scaptodrosophila lebanonensis]